MCRALFESALARRQRRARLSPIFPQLSPLFPIFCPWVGDPREGTGDVAILPTCGTSRRQGLGSLGWRREGCLGVKHWDGWPEH